MLSTCNLDAIVLFVIVTCNLASGTSNLGLGAPCENDIDCAAAVDGGRCRDNKCLACNDSTIQEYSSCKDPYGCAYHEYNKKCWKYREIGEPCSNNEECWIYRHAALTRSCKKFCVCNQDYVFISNSDSGVDKCKLISSLNKDTEDASDSSAAELSWLRFSSLAMIAAIVCY